MYVKIILHPRPRPHGRVAGIASLEGEFESIDAAKDHYVNKTEYHYVAGKKVYYKNHQAANAFEAGDFLVKVIPEDQPDHPRYVKPKVSVS